ncbi:MAG: hypothetical protein FWF02_02920 [Micrococcales bacterium]|nr:hypothetical protein [Micrococcales bacterium]MCL2666642.1 hypothetical protein [Micrococcales bacterium]
MVTVPQAANYLRSIAKQKKKLSSPKAVASAQMLADEGHDMAAEHAELICAVALAWAQNLNPPESPWSDSSSCRGPLACGLAMQHLDVTALRILDPNDVIVLAHGYTTYVDGELRWLRNAEDRAFHTMVVELYRGMERVYSADVLWRRVRKKLRPLRDRRAAVTSATLANLSTALVMSWERYGDRQDALDAVDAANRAVELDSSVDACNARGKASWAAYQVTGERTYLDDAVAVLRQLAARTPAGHVSGPGVGDNLLVCLGTLALADHDSAVLDEALALGVHLLPAAGNTSPGGYWEVRAHVVPLLVAQSQRDQDPAALARALALAQEASHAAHTDRSGRDDEGPRPVPTYPLADVALAQVYLARAQATGVREDIRSAVGAAQIAQRLCGKVWKSLEQYTADLADVACRL